MIAPSIASKVNPQYSDEGRKAGVQGTVVLQSFIKTDGSVQIVRIVRGVGFGLDEMAVAALQQWKFYPARTDGVPVRAALNIEINFNLPPDKDTNLPVERRTVDAASGKLTPDQRAYISCLDRAQTELPFAPVSSAEPKQVRCGARVIFIGFDPASGNAQVRLDDPFANPAVAAEGYVSAAFVSGIPQQ